MNPSLTRRRFLQRSIAAGTLMCMGGVQASARILGANDRLRIAVAGCHGRGKSHISGWLEQSNVEIAYLIDPDQHVLDGALASLEKNFLKLHEIMRDGVGLPEDGNEYVVGPWLTSDPANERHTGEYAREANALLKDGNRPGFEIPASGKI